MAAPKVSLALPGPKDRSLGKAVHRARSSMKVFKAKLTNVDHANEPGKGRMWPALARSETARDRLTWVERGGRLALSFLRERARTSHNGNSRKFVCMIMLAP